MKCFVDKSSDVLTRLRQQSKQEWIYNFIFQINIFVMIHLVSSEWIWLSSKNFFDMWQVIGLWEVKRLQIISHLLILFSDLINRINISNGFSSWGQCIIV